MKRKLFVLMMIALLFLIILVGSVRILNPRVRADTTAISAANSLYETAQYHESIQIYEQLIAQEIQDSTVFFNVGNAYFQLGDYGRAILNYRRAAQLNPRDADVKANLEIAKTRANVDTLEIAPGPLAVLSDITGNWLSLNETAILALGLWFGALFLFLAWRLLSSEHPPSVVRYAAISLSIILLIVIMSLSSRVYVDSLEPGGVVVAPVVTLRSEPGDDFNTGFEIFAGSAVEVIEQQGEWIHLSGPGDTYRGWVPAGTVETIALNHQLYHFRS
jgi:hypothetical protein